MPKPTIRALQSFGCALVLTIATTACQFDEVESLTSHLRRIRASQSSGALLVVQPRDCGSRTTDLALVSMLLNISEIVVLTDSTENEIGDTLLGLPPGIPVRIMRNHTRLDLSRQGVTSTPAIFAWDSTTDKALFLTLSASRQRLYDQLRTLTRFSRRTSQREYQ